MRRTNAPGITTPLIDKLIAAAGKHGGLAAKRYFQLKQAAQEAGFDHHMVKPPNIQALQQVLQDAAVP